MKISLSTKYVGTILDEDGLIIGYIGNVDIAAEIVWAVTAHAKLVTALELIQIMLKVGAPEYDLRDVEDIVSSALTVAMAA